MCYCAKEGAVQIRLGGDDANYIHGIIAISVVRMDFLVTESQSTDGLSGHIRCPVTSGTNFIVKEWIAHKTFLTL